MKAADRTGPLEMALFGAELRSLYGRKVLTETAQQFKEHMIQ